MNTQSSFIIKAAAFAAAIIAVFAGQRAGAQTFANPPTWMPMTMLNITFDTNAHKLAVVAEATLLGSNVFPVLTVATNGSYDPAKPWSVLNDTAYSRRLGWDDANRKNTNASFHILNQVSNAYGANAIIWIESTNQSPELKAYQAVGKYGVSAAGSTNADGSAYVDSSAHGYAGIFGTAGSLSRWAWDGQMDHNAYAVGLRDIVTTNQIFTATYRIYVGDAQGTEILNSDGSSPSTTTVWTWKGPSNSISANQIYGQNLVTNPGAELSAGVANTSDTTMLPPVGWSITGTVTAAQYDGSGGFPTSSSPGPTQRGTNFFVGGRSSGMSATNISTASQVVSISSFFGDIANGEVGFVLEGYLGGYGTDSDTTALSVSFLDASTNAIATASVPSVSAADRSNSTGLLLRQTRGLVPTNAVSATVQLSFTKVKGMYNDASADNITFRFLPMLSIQGKGVVQLKWGGSSSNYVVESASTVDSTTWDVVTNTPTVIGGKNVIPVSSTNSVRFYRLRTR